MRMGFETNGAALRMFMDGQLEITGNDRPLHAVAAPVTTRFAPCPADAEMHLAARAEQVLRHLATRLTAAHHQDRAIGDLGRISVVSGMELHDAVGELAAPCRDIRVLMSADGDDHVVGA